MNHFLVKQITFLVKQITAAHYCDVKSLPALPEPDCTALRNHLKQVRLMLLYIAWRERMVSNTLFLLFMSFVRGLVKFDVKTERTL